MKAKRGGDSYIIIEDTFHWKLSGILYYKQREDEVIETQR